MNQKLAIVTDSNCGITQNEAKELGIFVLSMPFYINNELYYEDITLTKPEFYQKLEQEAEITTSQPAPGDVLDQWDQVLEEYDELVHIPMSSGLSSSCETALMLSQDYDGKVQVIDNQRISVTMKESIYDAIRLRDQGKSAAEIKTILEEQKAQSSIYITVDTLKYLKKGGRITPAAAAIGSVLNIKPVLQIQGEKLDSYAKVRGWKQAKKSMLEAMKKDLQERFAGKEMALYAVTTCEEAEGIAWRDEVQSYFPEYEVGMDTLSLSVACHIGPGSMAIACSEIIR